MANGFNKGRYLLPTIHYLKKRITLLESRFDDNEPNWNESYSIAAETLDIKDLIADMEALRLTYDERETFRIFKNRLDKIYNKAQKIIS